MARIFMALSVFAMILLVAVGFIIHNLSIAEIEQTKTEIVSEKARGSALSLGFQVELLGQILAKMTNDAELLLAIDSKEAFSIQSIVSQFENYLPRLMKLRVLLPGKQLPDKLTIPHLGFADIEMISQTFSEPKVLVAIQGNGENRHLAITRQIKQQDKVVAVLFASFHYGFLQKTLREISVDNMYVELKQDNLVLARTGSNVLKSVPELGKVKIKGSNWAIHYWMAPVDSLSYMTLLITTVLVAIVFLFVASVVAYRRENFLLHKDQNVVVAVVRNLLKGHPPGSSPVAFNETKVLISNLLQLQRISVTQQAKEEGGSESELESLLDTMDMDDDL